MVDSNVLCLVSGLVSWSLCESVRASDVEDAVVCSHSLDSVFLLFCDSQRKEALESLWCIILHPSTVDKYIHL